MTDASASYFATIFQTEGDADEVLRAMRHWTPIQAAVTTAQILERLSPAEQRRFRMCLEEVERHPPLSFDE